MFVGMRRADRVRRFAARRTARRAATLLVPTAALAAAVAGALGPEAHVVALGVDHASFGSAQTRRDGSSCASPMATPSAPRPRARRLERTAQSAPGAAAHRRRQRWRSRHGRRRCRRRSSRHVAPARSSSRPGCRRPPRDAYHSARVVVLGVRAGELSLPRLEALAAGVPAVVARPAGDARDRRRRDDVRRRRRARRLVGRRRAARHRRQRPCPRAQLRRSGTPPRTTGIARAPSSPLTWGNPRRGQRRDRLDADAVAG